MTNPASKQQAGLVITGSGSTTKSQQPLSKTCLQVDSLFVKKQNFSTEAKPRPPCAKTWTCIQALQSHPRFLMPQEHKVVSIDTTLCSCWVKCLLLLAFLYFNRESADFTDISGMHFSNTDDERGLLRSKPRSSPAGISPKLPGNLPADMMHGPEHLCCKTPKSTSSRARSGRYPGKSKDVK